MPWYLDTSAAAKLIGEEQETDALVDWLRTRSMVLSDLHRTELRRTAARRGSQAMARADDLLGTQTILRIGQDVFDAAGRVEPAALRSLDALHLAAAQTLGPDLDGIVAYDRRLLDAAIAVGIDVASPGGS